ncbi:MAG: hypothetical protein C5B53_06985 [Candidatus Melainabacteria bacterium]|nr:MAG: hypothetical protein C5B53_06985 [Candidatus Melainabacteria bacterium]
MDSELAARLERIILDSFVGEVLPAIRDVALPECWLAGGAVRNTVWKALYGDKCQLGIKDFDVVFFDRSGDRQQERAAKSKLEDRFPGAQFDVKNQASFGVWRPWRTSFTSTADGVSNWLHTATAVGVRVNQQGEFDILAPHGLTDLFAGVIRPCPSNVDNPEALEKGLSFQAGCPALLILS